MIFSIKNLSRVIVRQKDFNANYGSVLRNLCCHVEQQSMIEEDIELTGSSKPQQILNAHPVVAERAKTRSVIAVSGPDSVSFLNFLTSNELGPLENDTSSVHTFFLNARGRIIHDALVYKPDDDDTLFVECDIASVQALQTHLIMYRASNNVDIRSVEQEISVWAIYDPKEIDSLSISADGDNNEIDYKHNTSFLEELDVGENVLLTRDPRMWPLGVRVLAPNEVDVAHLLKIAGIKTSEGTPPGTYKSIRYKLGIAEGYAEIGYGRSLPAEINGDYTNAISLSKSNYIGWIPDAFKKVVENRMLPLMFRGNTSPLTLNTPITDKKGKKKTPMGCLRGVQGSYGLGLMNIQSVLADRFCLVGKTAAECIRPPWWKADAKLPNSKFQSVNK